jgi:hypothetical protein
VARILRGVILKEVFMKTIMFSILLIMSAFPTTQPTEETIVKFDKAQTTGLREEQRNKLDRPGVKTCGEYFLLLSENEIAYMVKSGKVFSLRTGEIKSLGVEIDNKLKAPIAKMPITATDTQTAYPVLRLSQKEYQKAKDCLPVPK